MAVYRYLDVSTCHVTQKDMELLLVQGERSDGLNVLAYPYDYGAFIPLSSDPDLVAEFEERARERGYSESFFKLIQYARDNELRMVNLDADGDEIEGLDTHDW